jgi:hypothetical protein
MEHQILKIKEIKEDKTGYFGNSGNSKITVIMDFKSVDAANTIDGEELLRDASKYARLLCKKWDNYNTDHRTGQPQRIGNEIVIPISVSHWTGE